MAGPGLSLTNPRPVEHPHPRWLHVHPPIRHATRLDLFAVDERSTPERGCPDLVLLSPVIVHEEQVEGVDDAGEPSSVSGSVSQPGPDGEGGDECLQPDGEQQVDQ